MREVHVLVGEGVRRLNVRREVAVPVGSLPSRVVHDRLRRARAVPQCDPFHAASFRARGRGL